MHTPAGCFRNLFPPVAHPSGANVNPLPPALTNSLRHCRCPAAPQQVPKPDWGPAKARDMVLDTHKTMPPYDTNPAHYNNGKPLPPHPRVPKQKLATRTRSADVNYATLPGHDDSARLYRSVFRPKPGQEHYHELARTRRWAVARLYERCCLASALAHCRRFAVFKVRCAHLHCRRQHYNELARTRRRVGRGPGQDRTELGCADGAC